MEGRELVETPPMEARQAVRSQSYDDLDVRRSLAPQFDDAVSERSTESKGSRLRRLFRRNKAAQSSPSLGSAAEVLMERVRAEKAAEAAEAARVDDDGKLPEEAEVTPENLLRSVRVAMQLVDDYRLWAAGKMLDKIDAVVETLEAGHAERDAAVALLEGEHRETIATVRTRIKDSKGCLASFNDQEGWQFGLEMMGITTFFRPAEDGTLFVKSEGMIKDTPLDYTLPVIGEASLYKTWVPFCGKSACLGKLGRLEMVTYFVMSPPFLKRDAVVRGYGVDTSEEAGVILLMGGSVEQDEVPDIELPPVVTGFGATRMEVRYFQAMISPVDRRNAKVCVITQMDLKSALPQWLINFAIKRVLGLIVFLILRQARTIEKEKEKNRFYQRMDENPYIYAWLKQRVDAFFTKKKLAGGGDDGAGGDGSAAGGDTGGEIAPIGGGAGAGDIVAQQQPLYYAWPLKANLVCYAIFCIGFVLGWRPVIESGDLIALAIIRACGAVLEAVAPHAGLEEQLADHRRVRFFFRLVLDAVFMLMLLVVQAK